MKKQLLTLIAAGALVYSLPAQVHYSQNFSGLTLTTGYSTIPTNMVGINVDGKPGATSANNAPFNAAPYTTLAFAVGSTATDTFALCTSWLNPVGQADRWLITPAITGLTATSILTWESMAVDPSYSDGFEVWVSVAAGANANPVVADFTAIPANKVFTLAAEANAFTPHGVSLAAFAGQTVRVAFRDNSNDMFKLFIDDITVLDPPANDINLTAVTPSGQASWGAVSSTKTIGGTVKNNGSSPITAFTAKYSDGTIVSQNFTGMNLAYGQTYNFTFTTPYTIATATQAPLKVWVELTGDANHNNDTLNSGIKGYSFMPTHKLVIEEATGTWCGWCVRGAVYLDSMYHVHPTTTALIAVHNGDPMTDATYDTGMGTAVSGYPTILVDRTYSDDPSNAFTQYASHIGDFGVADLTITPTFNTTTRVATVSVDTKMASSFTNNTANNDYRLAVVFTEMGVTGTASGYDQHNYYSSQSQNLPLVGAGHNWQTEPATVPAANMKYDFVARTILGGFTGMANSLPGTLVAGTTYNNNTFTYTVPAGYNADKMQVHALLIDATNNIIYNANTANLTATFGIESIASGQQEFGLYPNPAADMATIALNLNAAETVSVNVYNAMGQLVYSEVKNSTAAGENKIVINTQSFANGMYNVTISSKQGVATKKLTISK